MPALAAFAMLAAGSSTAATSSTVVGATVPSATNVGTSACLPGTTGVTEFGSVTAGSSTVLATGCTVTFGSSNSTSQLRVVQRDRRGAAMAAASSGSLASGWGTNGVVTINDSGDDWSAMLAVDREGRVISANNSNDFRVRRHLHDGSPDPTFGGGSLARPTVLGGSGADDPWDLHIDSADRIVVAGQDNDGTNDDSFIARALPDGTWDPTFGTNGATIIDHHPAGTDQAVSVTEDRAGRYLLLSVSDLGATRSWILTRVRTDGVIDTSFGTNGHVTLPGAPTESMSYRFRGYLFVQPDDRIVVVASTNGGSTDVYATRLEATGALDTSYGSGGSTTFDFQGDRDVLRGAGIDDHGRISVAVGSRLSTTWTLGIARLTATGLPDGTWGSGGKRLYPSIVLAGSQEGDAFVEGDGSIMFVGATQATDAELVAVRVRPDGLLDPSFGAGGSIGVAEVGDNGARQVLRGIDGGYFVASYTGVRTTEIRSFSGASIDDWNGTTRTWGTAQSMFAACLKAVGGGAAAGWALDGNADCTTADAGWNAIPADATLPAAIVASTAAPTTTATATVQFGLKVATSQAAGRYLAPIAFEVVAP